MLLRRPAQDRGQVDLGWLQSRYTFSFADYYDPAQMGVSSLRVINDDRIAPGKGFPMHFHRDMEILSYVKRGRIEHQDSLGHVISLPAGEFQLMSAGTGINHSEYNPSKTEPLELLQIWIQPGVKGLTPGYQQQQFPHQPGLQLIAAPAGPAPALVINQDAYVYQLQLSANSSVTQAVNPQRNIFVQVITGAMIVNATKLYPGDGASLSAVDELQFYSEENSAALIFDLA